MIQSKYSLSRMRIAAFTITMTMPGLGMTLEIPQLSDTHVTHDSSSTEQQKIESYVCPMHPEVVQSTPGRCPICGMNLVAKETVTEEGDAIAEATQENSNEHFHAPMESPLVGTAASSPSAIEEAVEQASKPASSEVDEHSHAGHEHMHASSGDPVYVCPMHPQVMSDEEGRCPICGMDLVKKNSTMSPPQMDHTTSSHPVVVSEGVINQLGVRSAVVERGTLTRWIEAFGIFLRTGKNTTVTPISQGASQLLILAQVFEREAPYIYMGQKVIVRFPNMGLKEYKGKVSSLETQISQTSHTLQFRIFADNPDKDNIPGGMTCIVLVQAEEVKDALLVPRDAVIVTGKGTRVIVDQGQGRFIQRQVMVKDYGEEKIVIHSGLEEGEHVVVSAQFLLDSEANLQAGLRRLSSSRSTSQVSEK